MPIRCKHCGTTLPDDTQKKLVYCRCKKIAVDGCEYYCRVIGDEKDWEDIPEKKVVSPGRPGKQ